MIDRSQYGEGQFIVNHFAGRDPQALRFLDVGSHDGLTFSNTRMLAESGWSGVLVEPSPASFVWLMHNYRDNPRMQFVNAAIAPDMVPGLRPFYANTADGLSADALSTLFVDRREKWAEHPFREIWLPTITVSELAEQFPGPYHFVNVDVEGGNLRVLESVLSQWEPEILCVEVDPETAEMRMKRLCYQRGLTQWRRIGGNLLCWA